jgi:hypothetical protein
MLIVYRDYDHDILDRFQKESACYKRKGEA